MTDIRLENLSRSFGATRAVDGLTAAFGAGRFVALLGPSGCGKTTLLRLIAGLEDVTGDDALGESPPDASRSRRPRGCAGLGGRPAARGHDRPAPGRGRPGLGRSGPAPGPRRATPVSAR